MLRVTVVLGLFALLALLAFSSCEKNPLCGDCLESPVEVVFATDGSSSPLESGSYYVNGKTHEFGVRKFVSDTFTVKKKQTVSFSAYGAGPEIAIWRDGEIVVYATPVNSFDTTIYYTIE